MENQTDTPPESNHHIHINKQWKARLFVSMAMLVLAFIGLVVIDIHAKSYWVYCRIMAVLYALLSIWLFWYLNRGKEKTHASTIWHQILLWIALLAAIYITSVFVDTGVMGSTQAGLVALLLLSLTIFIAGIYANPSFMLIGITLAAFAVAAAYIEAYLSIVMIPIIIVVGLIIYVIHHFQKRKARKSLNEI